MTPQPLCVTYWMNRLQNLDHAPSAVRDAQPDPRKSTPAKRIDSFHYTHPLFDQPALAAQKQLWRLQGQTQHLVLRRLFRFRLP